jgi:hypothetical protein
MDWVVFKKRVKILTENYLSILFIQVIILKHFRHQNDFRFKKKKKKRAQNGRLTRSKSHEPQLGQWLFKVTFII